MENHYWDDKIDYLMRTRDLYYNDDYLEFLVKTVWKIEKPVRMIDFGCGYGYLGLKLLPLLPAGSSYTGVDLGGRLLEKARELFAELPYRAEFIQCDVNAFKPDRAYDLAVCHAVLLHMPDPVHTLSVMLNALAEQGRIVCFEPHWIANLSTFHLSDADHTAITRLGVLQPLFEEDARRTGKDGNIGIKLPAYLSLLGVKNVECRVSDKVVFLDPAMEEERKARLYNALREDGIGAHPGDREEYVAGLVSRGVGQAEALTQYEAELSLSRRFTMDAAFAAAAGMKITTGTVDKRADDAFGTRFTKDLAAVD